MLSGVEECSICWHIIIPPCYTYQIRRCKTNVFGTRRESIHFTLHSERLLYIVRKHFLLLHLLLSGKQMLSKTSPPTFYTLLFNDSHKTNIFTALLAGGIEMNRIERDRNGSFLTAFLTDNQNIWTWPNIESMQKSDIHSTECSNYIKEMCYSSVSSSLSFTNTHTGLHTTTVIFIQF